MYQISSSPSDEVHQTRSLTDGGATWGINVCIELTKLNRLVSRTLTGRSKYPYTSHAHRSSMMMTRHQLFV
eukprot:2013254-Pleurochrysis_carterae.AAC.1